MYTWLEDYRVMGYNLIILMYHTTFYSIAIQHNVYFMSFLTAAKKSSDTAFQAV